MRRLILIALLWSYPVSSALAAETLPARPVQATPVLAMSAGVASSAPQQRVRVEMPADRNEKPPAAAKPKGSWWRKATTALVDVYAAKVASE